MVAALLRSVKSFCHGNPHFIFLNGIFPFPHTNLVEGTGGGCEGTWSLQKNGSGGGSKGKPGRPPAVRHSCLQDTINTASMEKHGDVRRERTRTSH
jgi:hypothetical protein